MLDLIVQPTDEPEKQPVAACEIHGGFDLVHGPGGFHAAGFLLRKRKIRSLHAVRHLKHDAQHDPLHERAARRIDRGEGPTSDPSAPDPDLNGQDPIALKGEAIDRHDITHAEVREVCDAITEFGADNSQIVSREGAA